MHETVALADFASSLRYDDIPSAPLERARNTICDVMGAIVFGYGLDLSKIVVEHATRYGPGGGCRILAPGGGLVQPQMAALANGTMAHAFALDGAAKPNAGAHPAATIFPATVAIAQDRKLGGRELITAFVVATEVMLRIGYATRKSNEHRGFHAPSTTGAFGASVGAGRLLGFDATTMTNALGIAASFSSGLVQFSRSTTGGMIKRLHLGRASESGVTAATLAERGFSAPPDAIEGEFGFLRAFCDEWDMSKLTEGLGETFLTLNIYMKRYPCHGNCQAPLQAAEELQAKHTFSATDIEAIEVAGTDEMVERHSSIEPVNPTAAQNSVPFCVALAFFRNPKDPRSFDDACTTDEAIRALCKRVTLRAQEPKGSSVISMRVALRDGRVLQERVDVVKCTPRSPPSPQDVYEKYSLLTRHCPAPKMDEIFDRLQNIEKETDFSWLRVEGTPAGIAGGS